MFTLPGRSSDAGPDTRLDQPEPPQSWDDAVIEAEDELRGARRLYRDNLTLQRSLRLEALDRAEDAIIRARALLEGSTLIITGQQDAERIAAMAAGQVRR